MLLKQIKNAVLRPIVVMIVLMGFLFWLSSNLFWGKDYWKTMLESDARGYYVYLPATFVYHDLNLGFFDSLEHGKYYDSILFNDYRSYHEGRVLSKFYCGTALVQAPFYLAAHGYVLATGGDADGYSKPYYISISFAALFYLFVGLWFLSKFLALYNIRNENIAITLFMAVMGTNLMYYSVCEPGMSHVYSFGMISMFLFALKKYTLEYRPRTLIWAGFALGLVILIRPINGLILLTLPFLAGTAEQLGQTLRNVFRQWPWLILTALSTASVIGIQMTVHYLQTGHLLVDSYVGEYFDFTNPHMLAFLISYKKGLFLYTPMYLVALTGTWFMAKQKPFAVASFILFFTLVVYLFSCWHNWWYGGSFSTRVFVEYLPLFMLMLGIALESIQKQASRTIFMAVLIFLVLLCQLQTAQYRYNQIHWDSMTQEQYWDIFLRVDRLP